MWAAICPCAETGLVQLHFHNLPPPGPRSRFLCNDSKPAFQVYLVDAKDIKHEGPVNDEVG